MPEEFSRTTKNKKVVLPGGGTVLVPVITQISFIDPVKQYQEYQCAVDNSGQADRDVHVDDVVRQDGGGSRLSVERVDVWKYIDPVQRYQEKQVSFDNTTKGDNPPPYFTTHTKTHVVRYLNDPDDGNFIDSELIDEFSIIDPVRQYQEYVYQLQNPDGTDDGQGHMVVTANADDPNITDSDNGIDPPWRTDPFQNIVDFGGQDIVLFWAYTALERHVAGPGGILTVGTVEAPGGGPPTGPANAFELINKFAPNDNPSAGFDVTGGPVFTKTDGGADVEWHTKPTSWPWWYAEGPENPTSDNPTSDDPSDTRPGYHNYDAIGPTANLTHTWPFSGYTQYANFPDDLSFDPHLLDCGELKVSFGPIGLTIDGVPWVQHSVHISMFAWPSTDPLSGTTILDFNPTFIATFRPT